MSHHIRISISFQYYISSLFLLIIVIGGLRHRVGIELGHTIIGIKDEQGTEYTTLRFTNLEVQDRRNVMTYSNNPRSAS